MPLEDSAYELLQGCHARIRTYTAGLEKVVGAVEAGDPRANAAAAQCARYLREALPRHADDEDHSITPRLLAVDPSLAPVFEALELDHRRLDLELPPLNALLDRVAVGERVELAELSARVERTVALLRAHIATEEATWFPRFAALPAAELAAVRLEMHARRGGAPATR